MLSRVDADDLVLGTISQALTPGDFRLTCGSSSSICLRIGEPLQSTELWAWKVFTLLLPQETLIVMSVPKSSSTIWWNSALSGNILLNLEALAPTYEAFGVTHGSAPTYARSLASCSVSISKVIDG